MLTEIPQEVHDVKELRCCGSCLAQESWLQPSGLGKDLDRERDEAR